MKYLVMLLTLMLMTSTALAYEVPQDATIQVFDGRGNLIGSMSRKHYKVVSLDSHVSVVKESQYKSLERGYSVCREGQYLANEGRIKAEDKSNRDQEDAAKERARRNSFTYSAILSGGVGYQGLNVTQSGSSTIVTEKLAPVGMGQLCASKNGWGLCAGAATNEFFNLGLKFDLNNR